MVEYFDNFKRAAYNGHKFTRDDRTGYFLSTMKIGERRKRLHVYVYECERGLSVPEGWQIHHVDGNKNNNEIENLVCIPKHNHLSYHGKQNAIEHPDIIEASLECARDSAKRWHKSAEGHTWHKEHYEKCKDALHQEREYVCEYCGKKFTAKKFSRYCCNYHKSAYRIQAGFDNVKRQCPICGKMFMINKYLKTQTCSPKCGSLLRRQKEKASKAAAQKRAAFSLERERMSRRKKNKTPTMDAFSNPAARLGFGTFDLMQGTQYTPTRMTQNYELLTTLYRENWVVQNIVALVPDDVTRKWYELKTSVNPEYLDKWNRLERKTHLRESIKKGMYWARLYGGAAGVIMIKGQDDMSKPLDMDMVTPDSFQGLLILDRWTGVYPSTSIVTDPDDADFGLPDYYTIRDEERGYMVANVHHSRIIRFIGRELPWLEQVTELYWGESEVEAVYQDLVRHDNVAANMASLTFRANVTYMETDGLDQLLGTANTEMQRRFWSVMAAQSMMESNFGTRIVNKGDVMHQHQYTFAGLADVYDRMMMDVSGAARIPVTKLFGRSPAGMNATGESDLKNYYDFIDTIRDTSFRAIIERLLPLLALSAWGQVPDDLDIDFAPMDTPTAAENADVIQKRTNAVVQAYQADLLDQKTARMELQAMEEETGAFTTIPDELIEQGEGVTATSSQQMLDPMAGLFNTAPQSPIEAPTSPETGEGGE